jgi:hypothetical protein
MTADDPRPDARPEWDDLTTAEHDEHRSECPTLCPLCEEHRGFGECPVCGPEEANDQDNCTSCGRPIRMDSDPRDDPGWWREA